MKVDLGDEVEMKDGTILHVFMRDANRFYGVPLPTNFPRFVGNDERVFVARTKIKRIVKKLTDH